TGTSSSSGTPGRTVGLLKSTTSGASWSVFPSVLADQGRSVRALLFRTEPVSGAKILLVATDATPFGPGPSQLGGGLLRSVSLAKGVFEKISGNKDDGLNNDRQNGVDDPGEDTG